MSSPTPLFVVLCALAAQQLATTTPFQPRLEPEDEIQCIPAEFPNGHICSILFPNLTSIMAPNPHQLNALEYYGSRFSKTPEQFFSSSLSEFALFADLTKDKDACSNKIATLLCFYYFPSCHEVPTGDGNTKKVAIFPCRSLCEEVTALDSECTKQAKQINKKEAWGSYFGGCNYTYGNDDTPVYVEDKTCANNTHRSYFGIKNTREPEDECKKINSTIDLTASCLKCNPRDNFNVNTFTRNSYRFAINCTVQSVLSNGPFGKEAINCTVNKQLHNISCTEAPTLEEGKSILILGQNSGPDCSKRSCYSKVEVGKTYIVAGDYVSREGCEDTLWYATRRTLITPSDNVKGKTLSDAMHKKIDSCTRK